MSTVIEVKTVDGSVLEVHTKEYPTIGDVCNVLVSDHGYRVNVRLLFDGEIMTPGYSAEEFPPRSLIIVGSRVPMAPPRRGMTTTKRPSAKAASPPTGSPVTAAPPTAAASPKPAPKPAGPPEKVNLTVLVTATNARMPMQVRQDATIGDLMAMCVAQDPMMRGCRFLFHGHALDNMSAELRRFGVADGATVHAASRFLTPSMLKLQEAKRQLAEMSEQGQASPSTEKCKGLYEQSMRLLFSLDGLDLEGDSRQERRDLVKSLTAFQDTLGIAPADR